MKHTVTAGNATVISLEALPQLQGVGFRNEGAVDVFIVPGEVPATLPNSPAQGYNGNAATAAVEFVRWNGFRVAPGQQISFQGSTTGPIPRIFSAICESSSVVIHSLPIR